MGGVGGRELLAVGCRIWDYYSEQATVADVWDATG